MGNNVESVNTTPHSAHFAHATFSGVWLKDLKGFKHAFVLCLLKKRSFIILVSHVSLAVVMV